MVTDYDLSPRVPENPKQFAQRLLRELIIAQLKIVLFGGSAAQLIVGCESRKRVLRPVSSPG